MRRVNHCKCFHDVVGDGHHDDAGKKDGDDAANDADDDDDNIDASKHTD